MPIEIREVNIKASAPGDQKLQQDQRMASLQTDLGKDKLVLSRFSGTEGLSELFEYRVEGISLQHNIDFDKLLGTSCVVSILSSYKDVKRHFNGTLAEARWAGRDAELSTYQLTLRPWLWLLTKTQNCRIFENLTVDKIILNVLQEHGFSKVKRSLHQSYPIMEYCVQYRESDFAFVSRLMEEYGIYYYFDHTEAEHTMVVTDSVAGHEPKAGGASLSFYDSDLRGTRDEDSLNEWVPGRSLRTGKIALNDYDYEKSKTSLLAEKEAAAKYQNGNLEYYDYPGRYTVKGEGENLAHVLLEAEQARDRVATASGNAVTCCPGKLVQLAKHPESSLNTEYLATHASHTYQGEGYRSGGGEGARYSGLYAFQPSSVPFRATRNTAKPVIYGPQTAIVVGDSNIPVDKQGRIKVQFHWDRKKTASRWVRIGHGWAGQKWGDIKIPRKGMEVIVEFLEGDPDQPLVTGTVYNNENQQPYTLEEKKTISGTKSQTDDGEGYNEFIFDDKAGKELVRLHAQKDMDGVVENDETREVKHDVTIKIGNNRTETINNTWKVTATQEIEFTVGLSTFKMTPDSISISSPQIKLDATATITTTAGASTSISSIGKTSLAGALVTLN